MKIVGAKGTSLEKLEISHRVNYRGFKLTHFHLHIYFVLQELLQNTSPAISSSYGTVKLATTTSSSGTATSFSSSLRTEGPTMLVDPLYRLAHCPFC